MTIRFYRSGADSGKGEVVHIVTIAVLKVEPVNALDTTESALARAARKMAPVLADLFKATVYNITDK